MKQFSFIPGLRLTRSTAHGGDIRRGKRKIARPFDPRRPIHIVLRSVRAKGAWSMLRHVALVESLTSRCADKYRVRVHRLANVGNHLHLIISMGPAGSASDAGAFGHLRIGQTRFKRARDRFSSFLRELSGGIAFKITGATKINPIGRFWDGTVFSRVLHWGREFEFGMHYLVKNLFEAAGLWNRKKHPDWEIGWGGV